MSTQNGSHLEIWWNRILIHTLELKWQFSPYVCIGKPWICNVFCPPTTWGSWLCAHCTVTTFTRFGQNWSLGCRSACIAWVYYACIQLNSGGFWTIFFCLVCGLLEKSKLLNNLYLRLWEVIHDKLFTWACRMDRTWKFDGAQFWFIP